LNAPADQALSDSSKGTPDISSISFDRDAFSQRKWVLFRTSLSSSVLWKIHEEARRWRGIVPFLLSEFF